MNQDSRQTAGWLYPRKHIVLAACIAGSFAIGTLDYLTGPTPDLFVFSFIPIAAASWFVGPVAGMLLTLFSASTWLAADVSVLRSFDWTTELWNMITRLTAFVLVALGMSRIRRDYLRQRALNEDLKEVLDEIKQLRGILPMCSFCRRIRDAEGNWVPVEVYIHDHSDARISHGLCPRCYRKHYGDPDGT